MIATALVLAARGAAAQANAAAATQPRNGPYTPPTCVAGVPFSDVTCSTTFDPWIEQFSRDGITAGCGGGKYCPGSPVTRDQMAVFIEKAMRGTANWPAHTQIVWGVKDTGGAPDPAASGAALLAAVAAIPTSGSDAPSAGNPWLLKVGPGVFDLGSGNLTVPAHVDLEGSGRNGTIITSAGTTSTLSTVDASEIRDLTVMATGTGTETTGVAANGTTVLRNLAITAANASSYDIGVSISGTAATIVDSTITASYGTGNAECDGITIAGGVDVTLDRTDVTGSSNSGVSQGILSSANTLQILRSAVHGLTNGAPVYAIDGGATALTVDDSTINAFDYGCTGSTYAMWLGGGSATLINAQVYSFGGGLCFGSFAIYNNAALEIERSTVRATYSLYNIAAVAIRIGATDIPGAISNPGGGTFTCAYNYAGGSAVVCP